ncbi:50S ribosomal protein L25/general stress protein Ctc [Cutibacterium namnetense]|uniref:Large ribosomal subunit protein bL25 n=1 Tax=[Propionibacterium] namnetense SK182B-JCVI TaxID=1051006 RepID=F9NWH5_9ACTN|nr:50S ribosomal protein L25/general stress protein Ctc [Cutibacterium namnetense]EGR96730.1 ribosomal protein L25, Ctc-form [ [[Propionibacterium] namnetense SK182B-JCVI]
MADIIHLKAEQRTEFGKGAARRIRRDDKVPAVMYGHDHDPIHVTLEGHATLLALRTENPLLSIEIEGQKPILALPKDVQRDVLKGFVRHVDLLSVRRGEKVDVNVALRIVGESAPGAIAMTEFNEIEVQADLLNIPEAIEIDVTDLEAGTTIYLGDLKLPEGTSLLGDAEDVAATVAFPETEPVEDEGSEGEDAEGESEDKAAKE